jgi:NAD(P)-dependent dehydrogenase (short-subunit alcohol dehydrogenase family)
VGVSQTKQTYTVRVETTATHCRSDVRMKSSPEAVPWSRSIFGGHSRCHTPNAKHLIETRFPSEEPMTERLVSKRALVVGASSGIGREIAKTYASESAKVALAARSIDVLEDIAADIGDDAVALECDVRDTEQVDSAIDGAVEAFGGLDVVINSAGVIDRNEVVTTDDKDMEWLVDVNLQGMVRVARAAMPALIESEGILINVSSQLGEVGVEGASVYCATKGGINNLTRQLAVEYADEGVRVNALAPGVVKTEMNRAVRENDPNWEDEKSEKVPLGRLAEPEEVAEPAVFLASDGASYMTGHVMIVDGGYIAH